MNEVNSMCIWCFLLIGGVAQTIEGTVVDWNGTVDGNWTSDRISGETPVDRVILSGGDGAPVSSAVVDTTHACSMHMND